MIELKVRKLGTSLEVVPLQEVFSGLHRGDGESLLRALLCFEDSNLPVIFFCQCLISVYRGIVNLNSQCVNGLQIGRWSDTSILSYEAISGRIQTTNVGCDRGVVNLHRLLRRKHLLARRIGAIWWTTRFHWSYAGRE
jgi:hypothetical protein